MCHCIAWQTKWVSTLSVGPVGDSGLSLVCVIALLPERGSNGPLSLFCGIAQ